MQGRSQRRSRRTWIEGIKKEAEKKGIKWEGIKEITQDTKSWDENYKL